MKHGHCAVRAYRLIPLLICCQLLLVTAWPADANVTLSIVTPQVVTPSNPMHGCWTTFRAPLQHVSDVLATINGLATISSNDIWAVGSYDPGPGIYPSGKNRTLTTHWDGEKWNTIPSPSPDNSNASLEGVTALSSNDAWAVGFSSQDVDTATTLIMHWDGKQWTTVPSPSIPNGVNGLSAVTAVSANDAWAVGSYRTTSLTRRLILHWDGNRWDLVMGLDPADAGELHGIAAASAGDIWAVGSGGAQLLHWDGARWSAALTPDLGNAARLFGVVARGPDDVWAVGSYNYYGSLKTLTLHWNGSAWSIVPSPSPGQSNELHAVTAVSTSDIWAVGDRDMLRPQDPFVIHWDGLRWSEVPQPQDVRILHLETVAATPNGEGWDVWVGGTVYGSGLMLNNGLMLRHSIGPCDPLFRNYWETHGDLMQQGYQISGIMTEVSDLDGRPYTVQYFERAVFEYHPENKAPYDVLLSQLGTLRYRQKFGER